MKHYSKEFKEEALKLSDEIGVKKAAQQLGIAYYTLADWRSIRDAVRNAPFMGSQPFSFITRYTVLRLTSTPSCSSARQTRSTP